MASPITESILSDVAKIHKVLDAQLEDLAVLIPEVKLETADYQDLNVFANKVSGNLPDFRTAFLGLIGLVRSGVESLLEFKQNNDAMDQIYEQANKTAILTVGFPKYLPKLPAYISEFKKYLEKDSEQEKLCSAILTNLTSLETAVDNVRKQCEITIKEEKVSTPSPNNK